MGEQKWFMYVEALGGKNDIWSIPHAMGTSRSGGRGIVLGFTGGVGAGELQTRPGRRREALARVMAREKGLFLVAALTFEIAPRTHMRSTSRETRV